MPVAEQEPIATDHTGAATTRYLPGVSEDATHDATLRIGGKDLPRTPYGEEPGAAPLGEQCPRCLVHLGQFHAPGCIDEVCPACGQMAAMCACR